MKHSSKLYLLIVILLASLASAQVSTGTPPFGSFGGGPYDTVNLGNLDVHFSVPILHKAGRGVPFSYDLSYDSSIWYPATIEGVVQWAPTADWGWTSNSAAVLGRITSATTSKTIVGKFCDGQFATSTTYTTTYAYLDSRRGAHPFPGSTTETEIDGACNSTNYGPGFNAMATDGSGYSITVTVNHVSGATTFTVVTRSGVTVYNGNGTVTDANGNQLSANSSTGQFFDTLSSTTAALTQAGSGTPASPVTYTYIGPSANATYTMNYLQYTVQTAFGFGPSIQEYGPMSVPLVSSIGLPDGSSYSFSYESGPGSCVLQPGTTSCVTGRIQEITLNTGGTIYYCYSGGTHSTGIYGDGSTAGLTRVLNSTSCSSPDWQYARNLVSGTPGPGSTWTTTVTDPASNQTIINFAEDSTTTGASTNATYNFYETERQVYQGSQSSGTILSTTVDCYNGSTSPSTCETATVGSPISRTTVFRYLPNSSGLQAETDTKLNGNYLTSEVDEYDYGKGAVGALIRKTITQYNTTLTNGVVDRPSSVTIENASNVVQAYTSYGFDETTPTPTTGTPQHISITGSRGLLTSVVAEVNGTTNLYRKYTYFDTGTLSTSTDVSTSSTTNGATTTYNYSSTNNADCGNAFVTSITEPLGQSRSMTWDCNGGVMLSLKDENNNTSSTAYSGSNYTNDFWRPYSTTDAAGNVTDYFYYLNSSNQPFQTESKSATFNSGNSIVDVLTTTDSFGRVSFRQTKQGPSASNYDTVATCYDTSGRVSLTTLPYSSVAITAGATCPTSNYGTSYAYDGLNRQITVSDSGGGSTAYTYTENDVLQTLTSPTQQKQSEYDGLGRLKSVCEVTAGTSAFPGGNCAQNSPQTGYWTTYTYDVLGDLTGVTQNAQASSGHQTRSYVFDMLGRLTKETNPEMNNAAVNYTYDSLSSDASCGTYTSAGNMVKRLDAASNATCYGGYDALHRVGTITYPSTSTPPKYFVYDTATVSGTSMSNAKTRLAEAYTCTGTCSSKITDLGFSYWPTGQTTDVWELTPHSGSSYYYHVTSDPWPNGVMNTLQNLSGVPTITYSTDGEGRLGTASASSGQNPLTAITYDVASHVTALTYGSSDSDALQFDPKTGRMSQYQFSVGSSPQTDTGVLTWNTNWTLEQLAITDQLNPSDSQTCVYTHDGLGRAASANCGSSIWSQTFSYDPFGNITKTVPNGATGTSFSVNYDYTNNTNRITSTPFSYTSTTDPNAKTGDMTADNSHAYAWDSENHLTSIDAGTSSGICMTYDALGRAVEKDTGSACTTSPTTSTEIVYGPSGAKLALMNGSSLVKAFVPLPGGAQAVYNSSGLQYYRHPDWLGSSRLATTPSRAVYSDVAYAPYGENYAGSGTQDLSFTGQNQDTESSGAGGVGGLYDFLYRSHSPVQGRWLSPDPKGLGAVNPSDPQSWNRYAYVGNRPLSNRDPLGTDLEYCDPDDPSCGGGGGGGWGYCPPEYENCDPCDPVFGCGGPPGGGGGGGGNPGGGGPPPTNPIQSTGGVWPNNETTGLPTGLNQSPLSSLAGLLGLLPGIDCGGMGGGSGFIGATPAPSGPCPPDFSEVPVASGSDQRTQHDDTGNCIADTLAGGASNLCNGWPTDSTFTCRSDQPNSIDCCNRKESGFAAWCNSRNSHPLKGDSDFQFWWVKDDYWPWNDACCEKPRSKGKGK